LKSGDRINLKAVYAAHDLVKKAREAKGELYVIAIGAYSKVVWDLTAVAWLINAKWLPSRYVQSPVFTYENMYSFDNTRHLIKTVYHVYRDAVFCDVFERLSK